LATAPARVVASEPDERDPKTTWVTLQSRCRCGTFLGIVVARIDVDAPVAEVPPMPTAAGPRADAPATAVPAATSGGAAGAATVAISAKA
jgi:hypothetical protein